MAQWLFGRHAWTETMRVGVQLGVVAGLLAASACSAGPSNPTNPLNVVPSLQDDPAARATAAAATGPAPFATPNAEVLPQAAQPLQQGDYGIADAGAGSLKGTLSSKGMRCDSDGFLHLETDDGAFVAGIVSAGDWNCEKALAEWQKVNPTSSAIGVRYTPSPNLDTILIVNDAGSSMTLRVSGAWKVS